MVLGGRADEDARRNGEKHPAPGTGSQRRLAGRRNRTSASPTTVSRSSMCRRPAISRCIRTAAATSSSTTVKSIIIRSFANSWRRKGGHRIGPAIPTRRRCSRRSKPGDCEKRWRRSVGMFAFASVGQEGASADSRPRPDRREAALLRSADCRRTVPVRFGAEGSGAAPAIRARDRSRGARALFALQLRPDAIFHLSRHLEAEARLLPHVLGRRR